MGPEAMGITNAHLEWYDDKVCRNFLCGTCPHTLFTNTVSLILLALLHMLTELRESSLFYSVENGPRCLPEITHRPPENRIPASKGEEPS